MRTFIVVVLSLISAPAWAQAIVVATCGVVTTPYTVGSLHQLTENQNGSLCVFPSATMMTQQAPDQQQSTPPATGQQQ